MGDTLTVKVSQTAGPDPAFFYLKGEQEGYPAATRTRSIPLAMLADGTLTVATEKAALVSDVEQAVINLQAAEAAIGEL